MLPYEIEGINFLNTVKYNIDDTWVILIMLSILLLGLISLVIAAIVAGIREGFDHDTIAWIVIGAVAIVLCILIIVVSADMVSHPDCIQYYEVTVDDGVDLIRFTEHYEVIDQRGKIWTIKYKGE